MPLSDFLALVAGTSPPSTSTSPPSSSSFSSITTTTATSQSQLRTRGEEAVGKAKGCGGEQKTKTLYGCQIACAGSGVGAHGTSLLRQTLAAGAKACLPPWADLAMAAADAAIESAGETCTSSINAWLCAGSGGDSEPLMRTEAHYDGYHNMMCVLTGRKVVELWPPGQAELCSSSPAWSHHHSSSSSEAKAKALPAPEETLVLDAGCVGFWPEGWWHRVTSEPSTRAVNVWWSGLRPSLVHPSTIPDALVPFALRTLAHHATNLLIAQRIAAVDMEDRRAYRKEKKRAVAVDHEAEEAGAAAWPSSSSSSSLDTRRYPLLALPVESAAAPSPKRARLQASSDDSAEEERWRTLVVSAAGDGAASSEAMQRVLRSLRMGGVRRGDIVASAQAEPFSWLKVLDHAPHCARAETLSKRAMFHEAFSARRCVIPVSGFYAVTLNISATASGPFTVTLQKKP